jgi:hypothetical protein
MVLQLKLDGQPGGSIYEDYKFLTHSKIDTMGMQHLAKYHCCMVTFMDSLSILDSITKFVLANPFEYEEY